ncbi:MAG: ABC-2 family transporter protein [Myxococcota bacterium]
MTANLRAVPDLMRVGFASIVAYRAEMVIWILTASMPLIMLALWNAVAMGRPIAGYDQDALARYFTVTLVVRQLTSAWLVWALSYEIRQGALSAKLLKPVHPLIHHGVTMMSALPFRALVLTPLVVAVIAWRPALLAWPGIGPLVLGLIGVGIAFAMNFCIQALFGMLGFWIDKSDSLFGAWFSVWVLLSGYIAPLSVYPEWAQALIRLSPFRGMLGLPVELLSGELGFAEGAAEVALQGLWLAALVWVTAATWRIGVRRYGAFGA